MIGLGIIGCNYGHAVLLPAFRLDRRCEVVGLAGSNAARTAELARQSRIASAFGDWTALLDHPSVDAVAIATPPRLQVEIAIAALARGKAVFAEKPMADDLKGAKAMLDRVDETATLLDFGFCELPAWRQAKALLAAGAIGHLRHLTVNWQVENAATRLRLHTWKTDVTAGGGALGNLASHSLHYLEWFAGPISGLSARLSGLPDDPQIQTNVVLALQFRSGAAGSFAMSCAANPGTGHRLELYGDEGALVLVNTTADYMRGFLLYQSRRGGTLEPIAVESDAVDADFPDEARVAPVSRLASRFLDAIEHKTPADPGFAQGYRVQVLLDAVRRSHDSGRWLQGEALT